MADDDKKIPKPQARHTKPSRRRENFMRMVKVDGLFVQYKYHMAKASICRVVADSYRAMDGVFRPLKLPKVDIIVAHCNAWSYGKRTKFHLLPEGQMNDNGMHIIDESTPQGRRDIKNRHIAIEMSARRHILRARADLALFRANLWDQWQLENRGHRSFSDPYDPEIAKAGVELWGVRRGICVWGYTPVFPAMRRQLANPHIKLLPN